MGYYRHNTNSDEGPGFYLFVSSLVTILGITLCDLFLTILFYILHIPESVSFKITSILIILITSLFILGVVGMFYNEFYSIKYPIIVRVLQQIFLFFWVLPTNIIILDILLSFKSTSYEIFSLVGLFHTYSVHIVIFIILIESIIIPNMIPNKKTTDKT